MAHIVLVHGAFHGGWVWRRLEPFLRAAGHEVWAPTLTGCGERSHLLARETSLATHVTDVVSFLEHEDLRGVVLVGHGYGGAVASSAADRLPERVARLVYLDGAAPVDGQSASGVPAADAAEALERLSQLGPEDEGWLVAPPPFEAVGLSDPADALWVGDRRHPHPLRTLYEPLRFLHRGPPLFPRAFVEHLRKQPLVAYLGGDPWAPFVERAQREGWVLGTVDAGHDAMVSQPALVAETLLGLVG